MEFSSLRPRQKLVIQITSQIPASEWQGVYLLFLLRMNHCINNSGGMPAHVNPYILRHTPTLGSMQTYKVHTNLITLYI